MPRRIFKRFHECRLNRAMRVRLEPIEGREVCDHDLYANSPLTRLAVGYGQPGRPYAGYAIVDVDAARDIGLALRGDYGMRIPLGDGNPESGVDRLPRSRLWIPVHASCEAGIACQMLWEAIGAVVDPIRAKSGPPPVRHDPGMPPMGEDLDAMGDLV